MDLLSEIERPDPADEEKRERRFRLVASVGIVGLSLVGVTTLATGALFTDQATVPGAITAGTVRINPTAPVAINTSTLLGGMAPGDTITRAISVLNNGTLGQTYGVASTAVAGALGDTLHNVLTVRAEFTATCTPSTVFTVAAVPLNGSSLVTARALNAASSETLCVRIAFPDGGVPAPSQVATVGNGDNAYQGDVATATFTFTAQQRAAANG